MTKSISSKLLTLLLLSLLFIFQACTSDDDNTPPPPAENKYLTGITAEQRFTKAQVIAVLNTVSPDLDISKTPCGDKSTNVC